MAFIGQPPAFRAPIDIGFGFPDVFAPAAKPGSGQPHRFKRAIARQNHQVGPTQCAAILLFDRPQQQPRLVEIDIVRPGIERSKPLVAGPGAAAPVENAICPGAVPSHADEQRTIVAEIGGPPILAIGHQRKQVGLDRCQIQRLERRAIIECRGQRVYASPMLRQHRQVEPVRPPYRVGGGGAAGAGMKWAFAFGVHRRILSEMDGCSLTSGN